MNNSTQSSPCPECGGTGRKETAPFQFVPCSACQVTPPVEAAPPLEAAPPVEAAPPLEAATPHVEASPPLEATPSVEGPPHVEDKPAATNGWVFVLLAIILIGNFLWRMFSAGHEYPSTEYRNMVIGLDILCVISLIGLRIQASRQPPPVTFGMNMLFTFALLAGLGLFGIRMHSDASFWTGHLNYELLHSGERRYDPAASRPTNTAAANANTNTAVAASPSEVYKAFYAACNNKDDATMKTLIARGPFRMLDFSDKKAADERNTQTLKKLLEHPPGSSDDTRNEKINGESATVECLNPKGSWDTRKFVKEDGKWKLTPEKIPGT